MEIMIQRRKELKLSQAELAQMLGCSQRAVAGWELGERRPSVPMAKKIGAVLGFNWTLFYDDEESGLSASSKKASTPTRPADRPPARCGK